MGIKTVALSQLEADPRGTLRACVDSWQAYVIELPDHRLVAIQGLDSADGDDSLTSELLETNAEFRALVAKSKAATRKPFGAAAEGSR
jgi:hypothetical protein